MKRRTLLQAVAALPLLPTDSSAQPDRADFPNAPTMRRVRPGDPAWPDAASWTQLADQVGGNLIAVPSLFGACELAANGEDCRNALARISNPYWIGDQPAGTEVSGWLDAWTPAPSVYAIAASNATAVAAGIDFARAHNLRLVVKGGGHSYLGTSNAPDSLLIWTRAMNTVTLHDAFVGAGCRGRSEPVPAVSAGAGCVWMDLYKTVTTEAGRYVQGGGCTTVGVAGLVQSGGFGSFSKAFGTAAGGLLEAEVVTADGRIRVVNDCQDPELFWALKGGGGGSFGVVTRLTLRTHDLPVYLGAAAATVQARSDAAFARLIARFMGFYREALLNPHWGEQARFGPGNTLDIAMVCQGLDTAETRAVWKPFLDWIEASPDDFTVTAPFRAGAGPGQSWWRVDGNPAMIPDTREGAIPNRGWWEGDQGQVGAFIHGYDSLWLPASLLEHDRRDRLVDALFAASRYKRVELHFSKGLAGASDETIAVTRLTATHPIVVDAFALAIVADGEAPAYPGLARPALDLPAARENARAIERAAAALRRIAPEAGSYVSESNYFNAVWQRAYWGDNYARLQAVKQAYDPDGLFFVHHGVGSEAWSADGFSRLA